MKMLVVGIRRAASKGCMTPSQGIILAGVRRLLESLITIRGVSELSEELYKETRERIY